MNLDDYLKLNLDPESPVAKDLWARLDQESRTEQLSLTSAYSADGVPAYLTSAMSAWYNRHIQPLRRSALQEVIQSFDAMVVTQSGLRGKLYEHEKDKIDLEAYEKAAEERMQFERKTDIQNVHRDLSTERRRYEALVQEHGEAVKWRPWLYWGVLTLMIGVLEGLLNLESFLKIPGFTPALSTGSFLVVSIAFAVSAHLVGLDAETMEGALGRGNKQD